MRKDEDKIVESSLPFTGLVVKYYWERDFLPIDLTFNGIVETLYHISQENNQ